jgi:hypothetical protein
MLSLCRDFAADAMKEMQPHKIPVSITLAEFVKVGREKKTGGRGKRSFWGENNRMERARSHHLISRMLR